MPGAGNNCHMGAAGAAKRRAIFLTGLAHCMWYGQNGADEPAPGVAERRNSRGGGQMRGLLWAAVAFAAVGSACSPPGTKSEEDGQAETACANDGARFPVTGLCEGRIANYFDPERLSGGMALEGPAANCSWTFQETAIGDGGEALVYRALTCAGVTTAFDYSGGAHSASLSYRTSALGNPHGREAVRIFVSDPQDPTQVIRNLTSDLPDSERAKCEVQPAKIDGWPSDALVIGYNADAARELPTDEPNAVCGDFGLDEDQMKFWLVRDGYAFFFSLGQDGLDFDPNSLTLFRRDAEGQWAPASP